MRSHALAHGVTDIAMPKIGCGLDMLQWPAVRTLLKNIFQHDPIRLTVYILEGDRAPEPRRFPAGLYTDTSTPFAAADKNSREDNTFASDKGKKAVKTPDGRQPSMVDHFRPANKAGGNRPVGDRPATTDLGFGYSVRQPLPDVFVGLRIFLPRTAADFGSLRRHIVGFGGACLDSVNAPGAAPTHIVHVPGR